MVDILSGITNETIKEIEALSREGWSIQEGSASLSFVPDNVADEHGAVRVLIYTVTLQKTA